MIYIYHFLSYGVRYLYHHEIILTKGQSDLHPFQFGYETCKPGHHASPGPRHYWLIHYVLSGKGVLRVNNEEYSLSEGCIFVISPQDEADYEADAEDPWSYTWITFYTDKSLPIQLNPVYDLPEASGIFTELRHTQKMTNGKEAYFCGKIWELLSLITESSNDNSDHIEKALRILHAEYTTDITIEQIAERLHLEKSYFSHAFKKKMSISPKQYLTKLRMEQALLLLQHHKYSVTETAAAVGYDSIYLFSKMFKRYYGVSPTGAQQRNI